MAQEWLMVQEFSELDFANIQWGWFEDWVLRYKKEETVALKRIVDGMLYHSAFQKYMGLYTKDDGRKKLLEEWQGM